MSEAQLVPKAFRDFSVFDVKLLLQHLDLRQLQGAFGRVRYERYGVFGALQNIQGRFDCETR